MSDYPMLISNKLHSFRNFALQRYITSSNFQALRPPFSNYERHVKLRNAKTVIIIHNTLSHNHIPNRNLDRCQTFYLDRREV